MPDDATTTDAPATDDAATTNTTDAPLGESGQKALDAMKAELKEARAEARSAKTLRKELDDLKAAGATEAEKAIAAAKAEGRNEALSTANERIVKAEAKALAGGKFANPATAVKLLDLSDFTVDERGEVDTKAITAALDALLEAEPYLGVNGARTTPFVPTGARNGGPSDGDMNAAIRRAAGRA